jgi:hypothetical protein
MDKWFVGSEGGGLPSSGPKPSPRGQQGSPRCVSLAKNRLMGLQAAKLDLSLSSESIKTLPGPIILDNSGSFQDLVKQKWLLLTSCLGRI